MNVYLATAYPTKWSYLPRFKELAQLDRFGEHTLTDDVEQADVIFFVDARHEHGDWRFKTLRRHPLVRRYAEKCFVYNEMDQPWCCMPGLYVSMPKRWFTPKQMAAWSYIGLMNPYLEAASDEAFDIEPDLLFSFAGRRCVPVRDAVLQLQHPDALIQDTSDFNFFGSANRTAEEMDKQRLDYASLIRRSRFVLCPRGSGPASFRLFESLAAGRVPVILGDEWVAPQGPDWDACSLRIPEAQVAELPRLIEEANTRWEELSANALATWREWFSTDVQFHRMAQACLKLKATASPYAFWKPNRVTGRRLWLEARELRSGLRSF